MYILAILGIAFLVLSQEKGSIMSQDTDLNLQALEYAKSQIGVKEDPPGSNKDPNGTIMGYMQAGCWNPSWGTGPWCAGFVSACWSRISQPIYFNTCTVSSLENFASQHSVWQRIESTSDFEKVKPGNFFTIDSNKNGVSDHCGIVEYYDKNTKTLHTIEGNYNNRVQRVQRRTTLNQVVGFSTIDNFIQTSKCS